MPTIPLGVSVAEAAALNLLQTILVRSRSIGPFTADVTLEEHHEDRLRITDIPVEQGADITDHAYRQPARLVIRCGFSDSSLSAGGNPNYDQQVYTNFQIMQRKLEPVTVVTGKRVYPGNMLVESIGVTTNEATEHALLMTVELREIIVVTTQTVAVPPAANLANPAANGPTNPVGPKLVQPGTQFNFGG